MMKKKDRFTWGAIILVSISAIAISIYQNQEVEDLLKLDQTYVLGVVMEKRTPTYGDPIVVYRYHFNGKKYLKESSVPGYGMTEGDRYFVSIPEGHEDQPPGVEAGHEGRDHQHPEGPTRKGMRRTGDGGLLGCINAFDDHVFRQEASEPDGRMRNRDQRNADPSNRQRAQHHHPIGDRDLCL